MTICNDVIIDVGISIYDHSYITKLHLRSPLGPEDNNIEKCTNLGFPSKLSQIKKVC